MTTFEQIEGLRGVVSTLASGATHPIFERDTANELLDALAFSLSSLEAEREKLLEVLRDVEVFYPELLTLVDELREDAESRYVPEKGWPPHIAAAHRLGDHDEAIESVRAALVSAGSDSDAAA